jgi:putative oxidoreductase
MNSAKAYNVGGLILRLAIGGLLLLHGIDKLKNGVGSIEGALGEAGLPSFIAYGVYVGEVLAPIFLILGAWTRIAALVVAFNMFMAIVIAHGQELFATNEHGGAKIELELLYLFGAIALALMGGGAWSVTKGRWS